MHLGLTSKSVKFDSLVYMLFHNGYITVYVIYSYLNTGSSLFENFSWMLSCQFKHFASNLGVIGTIFTVSAEATARKIQSKYMKQSDPWETGDKLGESYLIVSFTWFIKLPVFEVANCFSPWNSKFKESRNIFFFSIEGIFIAWLASSIKTRKWFKHMLI